jgi:hypothetical protein
MLNRKTRKRKEREGGTLIIIFNVRNLASGMKKTPFPSTDTMSKWNRGQRR